MKINWLYNPHNWFGKWLYLPPIYQLLIFSFIILLSLLPMAKQHWQNTQQLNHINLEISHLQQQLVQQQKLLQVLKTRVNHNQPSPELARAILPLNLAIQQAERPDLIIEKTQWDFNQQLILELNIMSNFQPLRQFILKLLSDYPALQLIRLDINQQTTSELHSINALLLLQLRRE